MCGRVYSILQGDKEIILNCVKLLAPGFIKCKSADAFTKEEQTTIAKRGRAAEKAIWSLMNMRLDKGNSSTSQPQ